MQTTLSEWIFTPPRTLVIGGGSQCQTMESAFVGCGRLEDAALQDFPSEWKETGIRQTPLRNVRGVVLVKGSEDEPALLPWRHARVWEWLRVFGRAERQRVRWVIQCSGADMEEVCDTPLAGSGDGVATFGHFPGYTVRSFGVGIGEIRAALSSIEPTDLITWEALKRTDKARNALVTLHDVLHDERLDGHVVTAALRMVHDVFDEQPYEIDRFCRPNCHEHGGQWRRWLASASEQAMTDNVTHIIQGGRALLPLLQL